MSLRSFFCATAVRLTGLIASPFFERVLGLVVMMSESAHHTPSRQQTALDQLSAARIWINPILFSSVRRARATRSCA
ncbi:hypothetical protein [Nannocystis radixulma]|uniref:Secreted protein n=1 Tax=Nannocystis radixulma TaxID=2995305 RepID=A0ABT5BP63_9BACT|nr:hypothetical protein [Nannocystis radixulma]MDC0675314.1 hypothetical protein [Nannocystis radixulma]